MNWAEEFEKPPSFLTKTENQRLNWRKPANRKIHQNRKPAIIKSENRKTESKIGQIRKTENPNAPLLNVTILYRKIYIATQHSIQATMTVTRKSKQKKTWTTKVREK